MTVNENKLENTPTGGALVGKRKGQTMIHNKGSMSGYLVGKTHAEGGIKAINKSTGQPLEMQGGEVVITAPAVSDQTKHQFDGKMMTNREILSTINERGGGVAFAEDGMEIPFEMHFSGESYNFGGKMVSDHDIAYELSQCDCEHKMKPGGHLAKNMSLEDIAKMHNVSMRQINKQVSYGMEAESEHTSSEGEQLRIVKDHLYENPNYYTILKTAGLENGGGLNKITYKTDNEIYANDLMKYADLQGIEASKKVVRDYYFITTNSVIEPRESMPNKLKSLVVAKMENGAKLDKEDLVKDSKSGNTPARDLNNYNDVMDVGVDSEVGGQNGLAFENGGGVNELKIDKDLLREDFEKIKNSPLFRGSYPFLYDDANSNSNGVSIKIEGSQTIYDPSFREYKTVGKYSDTRDILEALAQMPNRNYSYKVRIHEIPVKEVDNVNELNRWDDSVVVNETEFYLIPEKLKKQLETGGDVNYDKGGQTLSAEVFEWDKVPTNYRNISKVKKVPFTNNPLDKGLDSIISPFLGKDIYRPSMMGVNFDENGITATNAFVLITLPYPNEKYNGIYDINKVKKEKSSEILLINENYPKYQNIIPNFKDAGTPYLISVYKLLQYTKTAMNYANKVTHAISYKFGDNEAIGFNGQLLSEVLTTVLKLGHEKIYIFAKLGNRAIILSPNKEYELGSDEILLTMPVMLTSTYSSIKGYGTEDVEYNRSLKAYFDFNDNEIHNADGSIANFEMQYENNLSVDDSYLALLSKITNKVNRIPILGYAKVENNKMSATDLDISLIVKDVNMPDGIYEIVNKAPNITMQPIEDFPKLATFNKDEYISKGSEETRKFTAFEFVTFSEVFEFYLDKLLLSVGDDDLRPIMSGISLKKTAQNEIFLVATNAHTLCKINFTQYCEFEKDDRELEYVFPVKYLKDFMKLVDGSLHFKCNVGNIFIEAQNLQYNAKLIDGKYPNYDAVIPKDNTKKIVFDHVAMNKCMKSPEVASQVAKYKGDNSIKFDFVNDGNVLFLKIRKDVGYNRDMELIDKIKLCDIDFNYEKVSTYINLDQSIFLLMPVKDDFTENQYFAFRKNFFDVMLKTITDTEVECYFSEPNRGCVFTIDAIDYKKTLPEEKTKQQPKKLAKSKKQEENVEKTQLNEAIQTLVMLAELENDEQQRKEIYEALEILNMLKEQNFEDGGQLGNKLVFEPIKTPLN
jgi:hypothetical protein